MASITIFPLQDVYISQWYADLNFFSVDALFVSQYLQVGDVYRSLVQFDLSAIPSGSNIVSAELDLFLYRNETNSSVPVTTRRVLNPWNQTSVTWNSQPAFDANNIDGSVIISPATPLGFISMNLTELVTKWFNGTVINDGIYLIGDEFENNLAGFKSSRDPFSSEWPRLIINYEPPGISSSFGSFFRNGLIVIDNNQPIPWNGTGQTTGGVSLADSFTISVTQAGSYYIEYCVNTAFVNVVTPTTFALAIFINDNVVLNNQTSFGGLNFEADRAECQPITGEAIVFIPAGASIQLKNISGQEFRSCGSSLMLDASINLIKLGT